MVTKRRWYVGSLIDRKLRREYRGNVQVLSDGAFKRVATVYADTLRELRARKILIAQILNDAHRKQLLSD